MSPILLLLALFAGQTIQGGSVEGVVVKEGTNEPVRGAEVRLGIVPAASNSVFTDDSGRFKFQNVPPGNYAIGVTHSNYLFGAFGQRGPNRPGKPVAIAVGQEIRNIVIRLTPRSVLYGRVFKPTGDAAGNIKVQLLRHLYIDGRRMLAIERDALTDDAGEYRFSDVAPQEYMVSAEFRDRDLLSYLPGTPVYFPGTVDPDGAALINVLPGMEYGGLDLTLVKRDEVRILGRAIDAVTGRPPAAFFVILAPGGRRTLIAGDTAPRRIPVSRVIATPVGAH